MNATCPVCGAERPDEIHADWCDVEEEECPYCGAVLFAPPARDPLKGHVDYCEKRPISAEGE